MGRGGGANLAVVIVTVKIERVEDESHRTVLPFVQPCIIRISLGPDPLTVHQLLNPFHYITTAPAESP